MKNRKPFSLMNYFSPIRILFSIALSLVVVFIIIFFIADDPVFAISKMMLGPFQTKRSFFNVIERALPIIFTALALNVSLRSGVFNIASDSSFYMGAVLAAFISLKLPLSAGVYQVVYILVAMLAGGLINMLPVILNRYTGIDTTVVALMQNSIFYYFGLSLVSAYLLDNSGSWGSATFPEAASLGKILRGTSLHWGVVILLVVILFTIVFMEKTSFGYKVRLTGINPNFARSAGIQTGGVILGAQFIGGAIAGTGGAVEMLGMYKRFQWQLPVTVLYSLLSITAPVRSPI